LRQPEIGLVMVRGRTGGGGAPFNLGEATVTRATVRLKTGEIGFAQSLGRDRDKALLAAIFDALWQSAERSRVEQVILAPLRARLAEAAALKARETAATKVNFFTLVRGED
jgi:alpha-D-ribose 1-methylphosphonate 5-triphosphate synthase subunit PhnG